MKENNVRVYKEVAKVISRYNENPDELMKIIRDEKGKSIDSLVDTLEKKPNRDLKLKNEHSVSEKNTKIVNSEEKNPSDELFNNMVKKTNSHGKENKQEVKETKKKG